MPPKVTKAPKIVSEGQKALQEAVLRNYDSQPGGSRMLGGYTTSEESRLELMKFVNNFEDGKVYKTDRNSFPEHYDLERKIIVREVPDKSVPVFGFRILPAKRGDLMDVKKFNTDFGVKVHLVATMSGGDKGAREEAAAVFEMASAAKEGHSK